MLVCLSVILTFLVRTEIIIFFGQIAMKFGTDMNGAQKINHKDVSSAALSTIQLFSEIFQHLPDGTLYTHMMYPD